MNLNREQRNAVVQRVSEKYRELWMQKRKRERLAKDEELKEQMEARLKKGLTAKEARDFIRSRDKQEYERSIDFLAVVLKLAKPEDFDRWGRREKPDDPLEKLLKDLEFELIMADADGYEELVSRFEKKLAALVQ